MVQYLGIVRGIVVRAPTISQNLVGGFKSILGGHIEEYTEICERARLEAYDHMIQHAQDIGADASIGKHYDATEFSQSVTEVLAYGTAVKLE